jgi:hypothetical protein
MISYGKHGFAADMLCFVAVVGVVIESNTADFKSLGSRLQYPFDGGNDYDYDNENDNCHGQG